MRHIPRSLLALALTHVLACGGGSAASEPSTSSPSAPAQEETGAASAGGIARAGDPCDFGGAERYTCQAGLQCCYPEQGEVEYGTCAASCPGYD